MTQLSRLAILGIGKETTAGSYAAPTAYIPFLKADFEDQYAAIKDESYRANDTALQGLYQGVAQADWSIELMAYPNLVGYLLRGIIGPDTVTPGSSTTLAAPVTTVGATTISTAASIAAGSYIAIDTATSREYALVTAVSGSGPYLCTVTTVQGATAGLANTHSAGATVTTPYLHTFKQSADPTTKATYTLTVNDTVSTLSYSGVTWSDLDIKIDPKAAVGLSAKGTGFPGVPASPLTPTYSTTPPALGWQWTMANAGAASTRGLSLDLKMGRQIDVIHSSDGTLAPREIFQGAFSVQGSYKAIFENTTDMDLFTTYSQVPVTATLQQPISTGAACLTLTLSKAGWVKGKRNWGEYVEAEFDIEGIYNGTDSGAMQATLANWYPLAY